MQKDVLKPKKYYMIRNCQGDESWEPFTEITFGKN